MFTPSIRAPRFINGFLAQQGLTISQEPWWEALTLAGSVRQISEAQKNSQRNSELQLDMTNCLMTPTEYFTYNYRIYISSHLHGTYSKDQPMLGGGDKP